MPSTPDVSPQQSRQPLTPDVQRLIWILLEGHATRVAEATVALARNMGLTDSELVNVRRGALLHDVGKLELPDDVIYNEGPLTANQWELMRRHPESAVQVLSPITELQPALAIPECHHENWDGSGYPHGLQGTEIPLEARMFKVVDVWDALTSDRIYREAWSREDTINYIRERSGTEFDPQVVDVFLGLLDEIPALNERTASPPKPLRTIGFRP